MNAIKRQLLSFARASLGAGALCSIAAGAQAQAGSITFTPVMAAAPASIPMLGSTLLLLLALMLAFVAVVSLRTRKSGVVPMLAGTLALASLISAGGGISMMQQARAGGIAGIIILDPAGETVDIIDGQLNSYENSSGVTLRAGPVTLPGTCPASALQNPGACSDGLELSDGAMCEIDCITFNASDVRLKTDIVQIGSTASGLPWYQFRYINDATLYEGVMAQDVLTHTPAAVQLMPNGYMAVNYGMLGLSMRTVDVP